MVNRSQPSVFGLMSLGLAFSSWITAMLILFDARFFFLFVILCAPIFAGIGLISTGVGFFLCKERGKVIYLGALGNIGFLGGYFAVLGHLFFVSR